MPARLRYEFYFVERQHAPLGAEIEPHLGSISDPHVWPMVCSVRCKCTVFFNCDNNLRGVCLVSMEQKSILTEAAETAHHERLTTTFIAQDVA